MFSLFFDADKLGYFRCVFYYCPSERSDCKQRDRVGCVVAAVNRQVSTLDGDEYAGDDEMSEVAGYCGHGVNSV